MHPTLDISSAMPRLSRSRILSARRRQHSLANPAQFLRIRRRAFLRATEQAPLSTGVSVASDALSSSGRLGSLLASPAMAAGMIVALTSTVLFLAPRSPLPWLDALRAGGLLVGLAYFGWYLRDEARIDQLRSTRSA